MARFGSRKLSKALFSCACVLSLSLRERGLPKTTGTDAGERRFCFMNTLTLFRAFDKCCHQKELFLAERGVDGISIANDYGAIQYRKYERIGNKLRKRIAQRLAGSTPAAQQTQNANVISAPPEERAPKRG